jgi:hypothetical protein
MTTTTWFGCWLCNCSDIERTPEEIPDRCPTHDRALIHDNDGRNKVPLVHTGLSGYGIRNEAGERV